MKKLKFIALTLILSTFVTVAQARVESLGTYSNALLEPVSILQNIFTATSVLVGLGLFLSGIVKVKKYRFNPHEVTFGAVITYLFFGFLLIILPFAVKLITYPA